MAEAARPRRLALELHSTEDPIQGLIGHGDGRQMPFTGWLELIAAIQRLAAEGHPTTPARPAPREDHAR